MFKAMMYYSSRIVCFTQAWSVLSWHLVHPAHCWAIPRSLSQSTLRQTQLSKDASEDLILRSSKFRKDLAAKHLFRSSLWKPCDRTATTTMWTHKIPRRQLHNIPRSYNWEVAQRENHKLHARTVRVLWTLRTFVNHRWSIGQSINLMNL